MKKRNFLIVGWLSAAFFAACSLSEGFPFSSLQRAPSPAEPKEVVVRYFSEAHLPIGTSDLYEKTGQLNLDGKVFLWVRPKSGVSVSRVLEHFKKDPNALYAEAPRPLRQLQTLPASGEPLFKDGDWNNGLQYPRYLCKQEAAYTNYGFGPKQSFAAVIDSGVDLTHNELNDVVTLGRTAYVKVPDKDNPIRFHYQLFNPEAGFLNQQDPYATMETVLPSRINWDGELAEGHGSHVCGIIAGLINDKGMVGVCGKQCALGVYKVFYGQPNTPVLEGGETYRTYDALWDIVAWRDTGKLRYRDQTTVPNGTLIPVNLSFGSAYPGGPVEALMESELINWALEKNLLPVAAMGNDGYMREVYPASLPGVVSVGSVNARGEHSPFSTGSERLSVCAPGEDIWSVDSHQGPDGLCLDSGTSMAAPYVTGLVAYLMTFADESAISPVTAADIKSILEQSADDLGAPGHDAWYGHGLVNAERAVSMFKKETPYTCAYMKQPLSVCLNPKAGETEIPPVYQALLYRADAEGAPSCYYGMTYPTQKPEDDSLHRYRWIFPLLPDGVYTLYFGNRSEAFTVTDGKAAAAEQTGGESGTFLEYTMQ